MVILGIRKTILIYAVVLVTIFLSWGMGFGATVRNNQRDRLRIIYSGGLTGNVEPCG